jgi:formimidoylglutamate deiminase
LPNRAILPGLVNAHSHAFQRVIRGRTEHRTSSKDSFWTWREMMYSAATRLSPEDLYDASRMAFMEMALSGITTVGEFHYLHNQADGVAYEDPNLLAKQVVRAAHDVGLRIALLRVAYARAGHQTEANPRQARFIEKDPESYLERLEQLRADLSEKKGYAWVGVAPHSVRAVPLEYLKAVINLASEAALPVHMHVAEQPAEISACIEEHGRSPVALLDTEGLLSDHFTGVHVIHITSKAVVMLAKAGAMVCACPTTERNLGDGIVPVDLLFAENVGVSLGTDSQAQIDLLEDARELEYHLRLQKLERAVLDEPDSKDHAALARRLFECATTNGARSLGSPRQELETGQPADFFTVDLDDPSIAGAKSDHLLSAIVFSLSRTAVKDVVVGGRRIVEDGRHFTQEEITSRFSSLQQKLWG